MAFCIVMLTSPTDCHRPNHHLLHNDFDCLQANYIHRDQGKILFGQTSLGRKTDSMAVFYHYSISSIHYQDRDQDGSLLDFDQELGW